MGRRSPKRVGLALAIALVVLAVPAAALGDREFPGSDPEESPRANTPNDPDFDRCESDDPDTEPPRCTSYWEEQYRAFGFSPDSANQVLDPSGLLPRSVTGTSYVDCSQLDDRGRRANVQREGDPEAECLQIAGVRADLAWKYSIGDPDVVIACNGAGSNFGGFTFPFLHQNFTAGRRTRVVSVEPTTCPTLTRGRLAFDYGDADGKLPLLRMHTVGHSFIPAGIHAGGLRYHGVAPHVSAATQCRSSRAIQW
jgi:hypothetical protein